MITCTSERSGNASTGVFFTLYKPAAVNNMAPMITINRLLIDHRIIAGIMIGLLALVYRRSDIHRLLFQLETE